MPVNRLKSVISLVALLLIIRSAHAQSRPNPAPAESDNSELTVRVTLPAALTAIKDYTTILVSKDEDKLQNLAERRKQKSVSPVLTFSLSLPKSWVKKLAAND